MADAYSNIDTGIDFDSALAELEKIESISEAMSRYRKIPDLPHHLRENKSNRPISDRTRLIVSIIKKSEIPISAREVSLLIYGLTKQLVSNKIVYCTMPFLVKAGCVRRSGRGTFVYLKDLN